jgi:phage terminase small subunit
MSELSHRQSLFVQEYLQDLNARQAAIRAGYSGAYAKGQAYTLLKNPAVQSALEQAMSRRARRTEVTVDRVVLELARIAFSDMRDHATWGPEGVCLKDSETMSRDAGRAVAEVRERVSAQGRSLHIKLHDKKGALELLGRHLGMFKDRLSLESDLEARSTSEILVMLFRELGPENVRALLADNFESHDN